MRPYGFSCCFSSNSSRLLTIRLLFCYKISTFIVGVDVLDDPFQEQTNFLTTPINPNLAYTVRTNSVGAHRVRPLHMQTNFYSSSAQDPSVVVPDTVGVILEQSALHEAKNLGHNSLEDDQRGFDICRNFVGAHRVRPQIQILIYRGVILLVSLVVILFTNNEQWYCSLHLAVLLYSPVKLTREANTTWHKPNITAKQYHSP